MFLCYILVVEEDWTYPLSVREEGGCHLCEGEGIICEGEGYDPQREGRGILREREGYPF